MPTPTSTALETGTGHAELDGRRYESIKSETTTAAVSSATGIAAVATTTSVVVHGVLVGTVTIPYNCEQEDRRRANLTANVSPISLTETTAKVKPVKSLK